MKEDISRICKQSKECVTEWIDRLIEKTERKKKKKKCDKMERSYKAERAGKEIDKKKNRSI